MDSAVQGNFCLAQAEFVQHVVPARAPIFSGKGIDDELTVEPDLDREASVIAAVARSGDKRFMLAVELTAEDARD
jgi:hypothetical protein